MHRGPLDLQSALYKRTLFDSQYVTYLHIKIDAQACELHVADVRAQVTLSLFTDFENFSVFNPGAGREAAVTAMLDEVLAWGGALQILRLNRSTESQLQD